MSKGDVAKTCTLKKRSGGGRIPPISKCLHKCAGQNMELVNRLVICVNGSRKANYYFEHLELKDTTI